MKSFLLKCALMFFSLVAVCGATHAQNPGELEMIKELWGMEKKAMLDEYMQFSQTEVMAFWPLYDEYMAEKQAIVQSRMRTLQDYAQNLTTLTDDKARELTNDVLDQDSSLNKLRKKYYKKMSKATSPLRASEFFQLERYLDTTISSEIQESIPFIGEINALKQ